MDIQKLYQNYNNPEFTAQRHATNLIILNEISAWVNKYPDMRFLQILYNTGIMPKPDEDLWHEEPQVTLRKLKSVDKE